MFLTPAVTALIGHKAWWPRHKGPGPADRYIGYDGLDAGLSSFAGPRSRPAEVP